MKNLLLLTALIALSGPAFASDDGPSANYPGPCYGEAINQVKGHTGLAAKRAHDDTEGDDSIVVPMQNGSVYKIHVNQTSSNSCTFGAITRIK